MSEENLFDGSDDQQSDEQNSPLEVVIPDSVKDLVGPGKKYPDLVKALEALPHAQSHIQRLEEENKQFRERGSQGVDMDQLYATVQELLEKERKTHGSAPLDSGSIESLLDRKLEEKEAKKVADANASSVREALVKKYGDKQKAQEIWDAKAKELGVSGSFLTDVAKKSSAAALQLFGLESGFVPTTQATRGTLSSEALKQTEQPPQRKTVMAGATAQEVYDLWKSLKPKE